MHHLMTAIQQLAIIHKIRQAAETIFALAGVNDVLDLGDKIEQVIEDHD